MSPQVTFTKLRTRNFLSLKNVDIPLGKLNVLIGPNASGKSNIVKALRLLAAHARGEPLTHLGYKSFKDIAHNFDETLEVHIGIDADINGAQVSYELVLTQDSCTETVIKEGREILEHRDSTLTYLTEEGSFTSTHIGTYVSYFGGGIVHKSALSHPLPGAVPELRTLAYALKSIASYSFSPEQIRGASSVRASPVLGYRGEHLARVLLHLYLEERRKFAEIERVLRALVPEVEEVVPHLEGDSVYLWVREKGLREPLRPAAISDGTLRLLAFVTALYTGPSLAVFEEPENCVHPHLLETLVDLMRKAPCQVLLTTHSPHLLDHVRVDEVLVVEKRGTETTVTRLTSHKEIHRVKAMLSEGATLGETWYARVFGGTP